MPVPFFNGQISLFWQRDWESGAVTMPYLGLADEPAEFVFGLRGEAPLCATLGLFGSVVYFLPSTGGDDFGRNGVDNSYSEETWNVSFGVVWAGSGSTRHRPLISVADNGAFGMRVANGGL